MKYKLHNLRTIYQDQEGRPIFSDRVSKRKEQEIDLHVDVEVAEELFQKYKVCNNFGREDTIIDIKLMPTILNIYKNRDE